MIAKRDGLDFSPLQHNLKNEKKKELAIEKLHLQMSQVRTYSEKFAATAKGSNINTANNFTVDGTLVNGLAIICHHQEVISRGCCCCFMHCSFDTSLFWFGALVIHLPFSISVCMCVPA